VTDLAGRVALVTGASAGIGKATATLLAREGVRVVLLSEKRDELEQVCEMIRAGGGEAHALAADLSHPGETATVVERAEALVGPLDLLVNNAGVGLQATLLEEALADVRFLFEVNFFALVSLSQQALRSMAARGRGHVINVSSASALRGLPRLNAYAASKGAVHTFTQALRAEARPLGIFVSEVLPVSTATGFFQAARNRAGVPYAPGSIVRTPEYVAARIVRCARRPVPEVHLDRSLLALAGLATLFPNLAERLVARYYRGQRF
jgi:short-subunit dehydrogenase